MYRNKKVVVVMPAYNAEQTLRRSYEEVCDQGIVDAVIIVDDCSRDATEQVAKSLIRQPTTNHQLPTTNHQPLTTNHQPPTTSHQPPTNQPPTTNHQPPTTNHQLPTTNQTNQLTNQPTNQLTTLYHRHDRNRGYGGNQKTCYRLALDAGADIVVMVHPDCQYTPKLIVSMVAMIAEGLHPCVLASRILGGYALKGGMPLWKYVNNRWLTAVMNLLMGAKLSEYHTGYRAFSADLLRRLPLERNMDDFAFDAQMLAEIIASGATIGEVSCPTIYMPEASSINFRRSCKYGFGCLAAALRCRFARRSLMK